MLKGKRQPEVGDEVRSVTVNKSKEKLSKRTKENSQQDNFLPDTFQILWFISFLNFAKAL